jgi:hypothetical protein
MDQQPISPTMTRIDALRWQPKDLNHLEQPFSKEEIQVVIMSTPKEKAPSPDGFIGISLSSCWEIVKHDIIEVVQQFFLMI